MSAPDDPSSSANRAQPPAKLGLGTALPNLAPPDWMSANIRRQAHEQAELSRQRSVRTAEPANVSPGNAAAPRTSRIAWLPLAGSLASLGVVLLLVTGQPFKQPPQTPAETTRTEPVQDANNPAPTNAPGNTPRTDELKREAASPSRSTATATRPAAAPAKPEIKTPAEASANSPKSTADRGPVAAPAQGAAPATANVPPPPPPPGTAPATPLPSPVEQAARAASQVESDTAAARTKLPEASPASPAQAMRRAPAARAENEAYSESSGRLNEKSAQSAAPPEPIPDSADGCIQRLEALIKAQRLDEARHLFRGCTTRYEKTEWPAQLRQQLGSISSN